MLGIFVSFNIIMVFFALRLNYERGEKYLIFLKVKLYYTILKLIVFMANLMLLVGFSLF